MSSVNKVILVGRLGKDPEVRRAQSGLAVATISLATSHYSKDEHGNRKEETEWHRVVFLDRKAEIAEQYLKKGNQIYIEGRLKTRKWTDQQGIERYMTEIIADQLQMLGSKEDNQQHNQNQQQQAPQGQQQGYPYPYNQQGNGYPYNSSGTGAGAGTKAPPQQGYPYNQTANASSLAEDIPF